MSFFSIGNTLLPIIPIANLGYCKNKLIAIKYAGSVLKSSIRLYNFEKKK